MSVQQMVCHVRDAFELPLGGRHAAEVPVPMPRPLFKRLALRSPLPWPHGVKTVPEVEQGAGGTPPGDFADDIQRLLQTLDRFVAWSGSYPAHPIFGLMTAEEWMRWGYLHTDHHLRQFGR